MSSFPSQISVTAGERSPETVPYYSLSNQNTSHYKQQVAAKHDPSFEGAALEEYCRKRGLCPLCVKTKTHKKVFQLFQRNKWEALTEVEKKTGNFLVYKGYCVRPGCFTLEQAKRLTGDNATLSRLPSRSEVQRQISRQRYFNGGSEALEPQLQPPLERPQIESDEEESQGEEGTMRGNQTVHKRHPNAFPSVDVLREAAALIQDEEKEGDDNDDVDGEAQKVVQQAVEGIHPKSNSIRILELSGLPLRRADLTALAEGLKWNTSLKSLILENTRMDHVGLTILAQGLEEAANQIPLTKLYLRSNMVGDDGVAALGPFLQANTTMEKLDVSRNAITGSGALALFSAFVHARVVRIKSINLSHNALWDLLGSQQSDQPQNNMEIFLRRNRSLRRLSLEGNRLDDDFIRSLASGLKENEQTALEQLYLGWNVISDHGAIALAELLQVNRSIRVLGMRENFIQNAGARAFLVALAENTHVKDISGLWRNRIERRFLVVAIRKLLLTHERDDQLHSQYISNSIGTEGQQNNVLGMDIKMEKPQELLKNPTEGGTVVSSMTNDLDPSDLDGGTGSSHVRTGRRVIPRSMESASKSTGGSVSEFRYDRLIIIQSTPLSVFDREVVMNLPVPSHDVDFEHKMVQQALSQSKVGTVDTEVIVATADSFSTLFEKRGDARVVHLTCSGPTEEFVLENGYGAVQSISKLDIQRLISTTDNPLQLIIVVSRFATAIGQALVDAGVSHVVCCEMDHHFRDPVGMSFLKSLYRALAAKKRLKHAFHIAYTATAHSSHARTLRRLHRRFRLLPAHPVKDEYHNIPIFFTQPVAPRHFESDEDKEVSLPDLPHNFVGRELEIFDILEAIQAVDIIRIMGPPNCGKNSIATAVCHYAWKRRDKFNLEAVFWLPAYDPRDTYQNSTSIYGLLCFCADALQHAQTNIWDTKQDLLRCQESLERDLEGMRIAVVIDQRKFSTEAAKASLEKFVAFLLQVAHTKMITIESREPSEGLSLVSGFAGLSPRYEETSIEIAPLNFRMTALLFGEHCKFISSGACPAAHNAAEFANLLEPHQHADAAVTTQRRSDLYIQMGEGLPSAILEAAESISKSEFMDLIGRAIRPEVFVDSLTALETEMDRRTTEQLQAVDDKNYLRAQYLDELLEEMEIIRFDFPTLEQLKEQEETMKQELEEAFQNRRYDVANDLKRELIAIKKKIMKEQRSIEASENQDDASSNKTGTMALNGNSTTPNGSNIRWNGNPVSYGIPCGEHRDCSFIVSVGEVWEAFSLDTPAAPGSGIMCWTNECCDLGDTWMGGPLMEFGGSLLEHELSELPAVAESSYGSIRCVTGNAVLVGPSDFEDLPAACLVLAVGPFSPSLVPELEDGSSLTPDALAYAKSMLRSCYRSSMVLASHAELHSLSLCLSIPPEVSIQRLECLELGLQTLVEEIPFTHLRELHLMCQSNEEACMVMEYLHSQGHPRI